MVRGGDMGSTTFAKIIGCLSDDFYSRSPLLAFRIFQNNYIHYFEFSINLAKIQSK